MPQRPSLIFSALICLALAGCGGDKPKAAKRLDTPLEAVSRIGDVTIRANLAPTASLNEAVARSYGIERGDRRLMLLVSVRKGPDGQDVSQPAAITASVANLHGQRRDMAMREVRTGEFLDYVGVTEVSPPDTLTFDLKIVREGGVASTMSFSRDFAPQ
jgi:Domain of unknown function (DUF4426)